MQTKKKILKKSFDLGPHPDSYRNTVTSKFEPHGVQRSPEGHICSPSGVCFISRGP